jgi:hypothetical protein
MVCLRALTVHGPIAKVSSVAASRALAAEDGVDARDQLGDRERLGDVVVGAGVEAADLVGLLGLGGEDDDRHRRVADSRSCSHTR